MRKIITAYIILSLIASCSTVKKTARTYQPVTVNELLEFPFGKSEGAASLKKQFADGVKVKKMVRRNKHDAQKVDSIFQFYHRKSEVFLYKTYFNREMLIGGVIYDKKFPLINGLVPGVSRDDFYKSFIDLKPEISDSVNIENKELMRKFKFFFDSKGTLKKISFSMYVD
ncbi:MAG: hypothetical protein AB9846_02920 [Tenuifilaceae bacterium]